MTTTKLSLMKRLGQFSGKELFPIVTDGKTLAGRQKRKKPIRQDGLFTCLMPGSSLLSHGETPHYHRRYGVSLLSSAWGQVGPPR